MSFAFSEQTTFANRPKISKGTQSWQKNLLSAFESFEANDTSTSESIVLQEQWQPIMDILEEKKDSLKGDFSRSFFDRKRALYNPGSRLSMTLFDDGRYEEYENQAKFIEKIIKDNADVVPELQDINIADIHEKAKQTAINKKKDFDETVERNPGFGASVVRFGGQAGAAFKDPIVLTSLMFGGAGTKLPGIALNQAVIGAGSEYLIQGKVEEWYKSLGLEYTSEQFWTAVALGGFIGGASPFAFKIAGKTINLSADQVKKGLKAYKDSGYKDPAVDVLDSTIAKNDDAINSNPIEDVTEHAERLSEADRAFENNELPNITDRAISEKTPSSLFETENINGTVFRFDPDEIEVDAKTFQFKAGADPKGVTDRLMGVETWDDVFSGQIVVYEFANGKKFIADGHQRLALAKRLKGKGQDVNLIGAKLKETDGFTPSMARVVAAIKNITEGTGSAIDAAKIAREAPSQFKKRVPPRSAVARYARSIVNLSDDDFGMVVNGVVDANYAAVVGRLIPNNNELQNAAMRVLAKNTPENEFQAEAIVRQVMEAGYQKQTTANLFGDEIIAESYFTERSKILDQAVKILRQDKSAFDSLVRNADRIEGEGNKLAQKANVDRATQDSQAISLLNTLANRKGNLSDGLTEAAKIARETGNFSNASRGFVENVRNAIRNGDLESIRIDNARGIVNDTTESGQIPNEPKDLESFSEPSGRGANQQADQLEEDIFGERIDQTSSKQYDENIKSESVVTTRTDPELDREIPTELVDDGSGNIVAKTQTLRQLQEEFAQDQRMLDRLEGCVK